MPVCARGKEKLFGFSFSQTANAPQTPGERHMGWVLSIKMTFGSAAERDRFGELFRPLAEWVTANEPNTLAYDLLLSDKDECVACVFERYATKADLATHQQSEPFKAFKAGLAEAEAAGTIHRVSVDGHSFNEAQVGHMQRRG